MNNSTDSRGLVKVLGDDNESKAIGSVRPTCTKYLAVNSEHFTVYAVLNNQSNHDWRSSPGDDIYLSYRWHNSNGKVIVFDGERTSLREPVTRGATKCLPLTVKAPSISGPCLLEVTLIKEGKYWLDDMGLVRWLVSAQIDPPAMPMLSRRAFRIHENLKDAIEKHKMERN
jgi:hypothetical protein